VVAAALAAAVAAVVAADAGKALQRESERQEDPAVRERRGVFFLRNAFSTPWPRLPARDVVISRFSAQTLHRFGAI
jgi:hypothetical protein